jgi:hypothetical protein
MSYMDCCPDHRNTCLEKEMPDRLDDRAPDQSFRNAEAQARG